MTKEDNVQVSKKKAKTLVWKVISSMPIDVFDDDDGSVWEVGSYELRNPRPEGDYEGSREIGAANLVSAFNLLHQKMLIAELSSDDGFSDCGEEALDMFKDVMDDFEKENLIRKRPEHIRENFRVIEGSNATT